MMSPKRVAYRDSAKKRRRDRLKAEGRPERPQKMTPSVRLTRMFSSAKVRSRDAGVFFGITKEDVVIPSHCPVLGLALDPLARDKADNLPTLDRIDNTKGYTKDNVWVISWRANRLKWNASFDELERLVNALRAARARSFRAKSHAWFLMDPNLRAA